jgi:capsular polysaccharide biosynthesis protein
MSEQALDLRRSMQIVRRHKILVGAFVLLGLVAGVGYGLFNPPMLTGTALVGLPPSTRDVSTQVVIASSNPVLAGALRSVHPPMPLLTLRDRIRVNGLTSNILSISAQGKTAADAEGNANAVANSYIAYVRTSKSAAGTVQAHVLAPATSATGRSLPAYLLVVGGIGALAGLIIGAIVALAISRSDRRLRERDDIANAIGVPVLASIAVHHPSDAGRWTRLLDEYEPSVVHAWQLRTALRYLGQTDGMSANGSNGDGISLTVLSLSSDPEALALGPQLAVYAASLGIRTALVVGPQQDGESNATAALRAACATQPSPRRSGQLQVAVADRDDLDWRKLRAKLTVIVAVVDGRSPRGDGLIPTGGTVLGVSAGAVTAVQLAGAAVAASADGRQIDGILVADPDPADQTTGRVPQLAQPKRRMPTRLTGTTTEIRR